MTLLQRLARLLGYDLTPRRKAKALPAQLVALLAHHRISAVLDVGANVGQYGLMLREWGYAGRIVSFEPLPSAHGALVRAAAADVAWQVAPAMALGAPDAGGDGEIEIEVSAETDMSSILPQTELLRRVAPSAAVAGRQRVALRRLDQVAPAYLGPDDRPFLKIDVQGYEPEVLAGARQLLPRLHGLQLEMSLARCYEGERDYRAMIDQLGAAGFAPHLFWPGYFEPKLARQLQLDAVFVREART
jgi:FkbM family methyltransferase